MHPQFAISVLSYQYFIATSPFTFDLQNLLSQLEDLYSKTFSIPQAERKLHDNNIL